MAARKHARPEPSALPRAPRRRRRGGGARGVLRRAGRRAVRAVQGSGPIHRARRGRPRIPPPAHGGGDHAQLAVLRPQPLVGERRGRRGRVAAHRRGRRHRAAVGAVVRRRSAACPRARSSPTSSARGTIESCSTACRGGRRRARSGGRAPSATASGSASRWPTCSRLPGSPPTPRAYSSSASTRTRPRAASAAIVSGGEGDAPGHAACLRPQRRTPATRDHGFPLRALVPGWVGSTSIKWLGRIVVSREQLWTRNNTTSYVLIGDNYPPEGEADGQAVTVQSIKSALGLPWPAELPSGIQRLHGFAHSPHGAITERRVERRRRRELATRTDRRAAGAVLVGAVRVRLARAAGRPHTADARDRRRRQHPAGMRCPSTRRATSSTSHSPTRSG